MNENENKTSVKDSDIDTRMYDLFGRILDGIKRFILLFIATVIIVSGVAAVIFRMSFVPMYKSSADFIINISNDYGESNKYFNINTTKLLAKTFPYIIDSGMLNSMVEDEVGSIASSAVISAAAAGDTNLFTLSVTAPDPNTAYQVLQSVIDNYPAVAEFVVGDTNFTLVDETGVVSDPINQISYKMAFAIGVVSGLAVYFVAVALYVLTHVTVRSSGDIKRILNISHLSTVPMVRFKKSKKTQNKAVILGSEGVTAHFKEAISLLRTRLVRENVGKVILVTSAMPGEGKTTISTNLAASLALQGKKVVLIDCDLRNPSVLKILGIDKELPGIVDYLDGSMPISKVGFRLKEYNNLIVIPGGKPCKNPSETVSGSKMKLLVEQLKASADYIVLDSTPCSMLSDAAAVAKFADSAVYVIRQDYSSTDRITDGIDILSTSGVKIVGCVLNMAEYGSIRYGYGGYGRYGKYGYGRYGRYGYGRYGNYGSKGKGYGSYGTYGGYGEDVADTQTAVIDDSSDTTDAK